MIPSPGWTQPTKHWPLVMAVFAVIVLLVLSQQLFIEPITGVANNGDFERVIRIFGLESTEDTFEGRYYDFINRYWNDGSGGISDYYTSEQLLIGAGILLDRLMTGTAVFEITSMGWVHTLLFLGGALLLAYTLLRGFAWPVALAALTLIAMIYLGSPYISYFNSFYSEPAAMISLIYIASAIIGLERLDLSPAGRSAFLGVLIFFSIFLVTSKNFFALITPPLAWLIYRVGRTGTHKAFRAASIAAIPILVLLMIWVLILAPRAYTRFHHYNVVFSGILLSAPDSEQALADLGVPAEYSRLAGTHYWNVGFDVVLSDQFDRDFFSVISWQKIFGYFAAHPGVVWDQAERSIQAGVELVSDETGHFEESAGFPPRAHNPQFRLWQNIRYTVWPRSVLGLSLFAAAILAAAIYQKRHNKIALVADFQIFLLISAVIQLAAAFLSEGQKDIVKHLFLYNLMLDGCVIILIGAAANAAVGRLKDRQAAAVLASRPIP